MQKRISLFTALLIFTFTQLTAQYSFDDENAKRCFVGSTFAMIGNVLDREEPPRFAQINFGYRLTEQDAISLELKTWQYHQPLGIPYGDAWSDPAENFPGVIREVGFAVAYQRFLWKGLYAAIHIMPAWQKFLNAEETQIDDGFQIFNTYRLGYHIKLFKGRFFIEPSGAITHRPSHTEMPEDFKSLDDKWSKFLFGEPGLHFGYNF